MHRRLIWIFAGSHHIAELKHAPWDSYLVSLRTIEVPPFSEAETRLLLTEPLEAIASATSEDDARAPSLRRRLLGRRRDRVDSRSRPRGWPHLVQLLAGTAVDLVNEANVTLTGSRRCWSGRRINRSSTATRVLRQLMRGESELPGEWDYLAGFRSKDEQAPPADEAIFQSLRRRQLVGRGRRHHGGCACR